MPFAFAVLDGLPLSGGSCGDAAGSRAFDLAAVDLVKDEVEEGAGKFEEDEEGAEAVGGESAIEAFE